MRVVIYDSRVKSLVSSPSSGTYRYLRRKGERVQTLAKVYAPKRSGELARSIESPNFSIRAGGWMLEADIFARSPHALFVHEGTRPEITSTRATDRRGRVPGKMVFSRMYPPRSVMSVVSGQHGKPFLARALSSVMAESKFIGGRIGF